MRRRKKKAGDSQEVDLTPMLDVVFIMLIFFIVTASFVKDSGAEIERAPAVTATPRQATIFVAITANNEVWVAKSAIDVRKVRSRVEQLLAENPQSGVIIQADENSKSSILSEVLAQISEAGASSISIAAENSG